MATDDAQAAQLLAQRCAAAMWADDRASQALGMSVDDVGPGWARLRMTVSDMMINGHDICHGGYVFSLADSAFAFACNTYDVVTVAAACDVVFVTSARLGDELLAEARERVRYGRSGVYDVTVTRSDGSTVAEFRGRSRSLGRRMLSGAGEADGAGGSE